LAKKAVHASRKRKEMSVIQLTTTDALISVSYDGAWQKRGKALDSITGFGTIVGESTGKVLTMLLENMANGMQLAGAEPLRTPPITSTRIYLEENSYPIITFGQQSKIL